MRLAALDITGFKSFAKHVRLEFQEGNTAIVGPNGSGKSNISDAIRWVLGEQSMKTLRGRKVEDVIYSGGVTKGRLGMAEVSLTLDSEGEGPFDAPEITITRRLYRSGDSDYLVNNRPVRLLDVNEILAKAGFAQKTYTVIGQGMADSFVNATAVERRAMFEDATGVTSLLIKKEQTERKLEQTKENLTRAKDHLSELEPRLRSLKRQAARARQREEVEVELHDKEEVWFSHLWMSYTKVIREADEKMGILEARIRQLNETIKELQPATTENSEADRLPSLRQELEKLRQEEQDVAIALARQGFSSEETVDRRVEEKVAREKEKQRVGYLLAEAQETRKKQEAELSKIRTMMRELQEKVLAVQTSGHDSLRVEKIREQISEVLAMQESLVDKLQSIESLEELAVLQEDAEKIRISLQQLISLLETKNEEGNRTLEELKAELAKFSGERENLEARITEHRVNETRLEMQLHAIEERVHELEKISDKADTADVKRLDEIKAQRTAIAKEVESLEKVLFASRESMHQQNMLLEKEREALHTVEQEKYQVQIEVAGTKARKEDCEREVLQRLGEDLLNKLKESRVVSDDFYEGLEQEITQLRKKLELIGGIDPNVIKEETEVDQRVSELSVQIKDLEQASSDLREGIKELEKHIHQQFNDGMKLINENFNNYFRRVFGGGKASLSVVKPQPVVHGTIADDSSEAESAPRSLGEVVEEHVHELPSGVEIKANPPGKKLGSISQLSGGEKALTSVALLFAIISLRNAPFIVFDEVDAALDEANSRRFASMLKEFSEKTQFLVITHNRSTMESANALYGVTMSEEGVSQLLSVNLTDIPQEYASGQ